MTDAMQVICGIGPVAVSQGYSRVRVIQCQVDGAMDVIDADRDVDNARGAVARFLSTHDHCGGFGGINPVELPAVTDRLLGLHKDA